MLLYASGYLYIQVMVFLNVLFIYLFYFFEYLFNYNYKFYMDPYHLFIQVSFIISCCFNLKILFMFNQVTIKIIIYFFLFYKSFNIYEETNILLFRKYIIYLELPLSQLQFSIKHFFNCNKYPTCDFYNVSKEEDPNPAKNIFIFICIFT